MDKTRKSPVKAILFIISATGALAMLLPFYWMITSSFKTSVELLRMPPTWIPQQFTLFNYQKVFEMMPFFRYLFNSVFVSTLNMVVGLVSSSLMGYIFAKYKFKGSGIIFGAMLASLMIPYEVLMIPLYSLVMKFGWIDSYYALTIPYFVNIFGIFLMRQFMADVPDELLDAANIDGCSHFGTFFKIVLPVVKPAMATLCIFLFVETWNSYLWPLIVTNSNELMTLTVGLSTFVYDRGGRFDYLMAASVLTIIPMLIVFGIAQKNFIEGIALSGIKG